MGEIELCVRMREQTRRQGGQAGRQAEAIRPGKERRGPTWEIFDMDFLSHFWWNVMSSALS